MVVPEEYEAVTDSYDFSRRERSSRSTYQRSIGAGSITPAAPAGPLAIRNIIAAPGGDVLAKLKRVAVTLVVPKTTTLFAGWFGFIRQPEGLVGVADRVAFGDPLVLRPSVFVSNTDNASYWTAYLPAVNLVGTGILYLAASRITGSANACDFVVRWIEERGQ